MSTSTRNTTNVTIVDSSESQFQNCVKLLFHAIASGLSPWIALVYVEYFKSTHWNAVSSMNVSAGSLIIIFISICNVCVRHHRRTKNWFEPQNGICQAVVCVVTAIITAGFRFIVTSYWSIPESLEKDLSLGSHCLYIKVVASVTLALYEMVTVLDNTNLVTFTILHISAGFLNVLCANTAEDYILAHEPFDLNLATLQRYLVSIIETEQLPLNFETGLLLPSSNESYSMSSSPISHPMRDAEFFKSFGICFHATVVFVVLSLSLSLMVRFSQEIVDILQPLSDRCWSILPYLPRIELRRLS